VQACGEISEQLDHVEVVEQAIDEGDDRVQDTGFPRCVGHEEFPSAPVTTSRAARQRMRI
jgi:hypothetical protein